MNSILHLTIFTDGGSRGNPGPAAYGFAVFDEKNNLLYSDGKTIGITTNNVAEYTAVLKALELAKEKYGLKVQVRFFMDSLLVARQLTGLYRIKNENLKIIATKIKTLEKEFEKQITYSHVPREKNKIADSMVNKALDLQQS